MKQCPKCGLSMPDIATECFDCGNAFPSLPPPEPPKGEQGRFAVVLGFIRNKLKHPKKTIADPVPRPEAPRRADETPTVNIPKRTYHCEHFNVAGTPYYMKNLKEVLYKNEEYSMSKSDLMECYYDETVWQYELADNDVSLHPEPNNEHDPNAIMVCILGNKIGYIKRGSCTHVKNLLLTYPTAQVKVSEFKFGKYKQIDEDGVYIGNKEVPFIQIAIEYFKEETLPDAVNIQ